MCFPRLTSLLFNVSLDVSPTSPTNISYHFTAFRTARVELYPHPSSGADQFGSKGDRLIILDLNGNAVNDVFQKASVQSGKALGSLRVEKSRPAQHVFYAKHVYRILHNIASFVTSKTEHGGIVYDSVVVLMRICQSQNPWQVQVSGSCLNSKPGLDSPIFIKLYTDFRIQETMQDHRQCQFKFPVPQINAKNGEKGNTFTMHVFNGRTSTIQELHRTHTQAPPKGLVLGLQFPQKSESSFVSIGDPRLNRLLCQ